MNRKSIEEVKADIIKAIEELNPQIEEEELAIFDLLMSILRDRFVELLKLERVRQTEFISRFQ